MFLQRGSRVLRVHAIGSRVTATNTRGLRTSAAMHVVKPVMLADIGEGIVECEVIQWFVQPGARVEEFSPLCEVQSDKASVEITSRFAGVVKKLSYEAGEMARVGKPFVEIDIDGELGDGDDAAEVEGNTAPAEVAEAVKEAIEETRAVAQEMTADEKKRLRNGAIATPAVRHLLRKHDIDITLIRGTGKDGRVLKEDVFKYIKSREAGDSTAAQDTPVSPQTPQAAPAAPSSVQLETTVPLSNMQVQMFKTMTKSLAIPHFLYADEIDFTQLCAVRARLNTALKTPLVNADAGVSKLSYMPFIIKAMSLALQRYPILNARVDTTGAKPQLVMRTQHNIGIAMDTPQGLVVPVIQNVAGRSLVSIAAEISRLQDAGMRGKLSPADLQGGTITVSNIGTLGGTYVAPVIVDKEVAILGVGRMRKVPAFGGEDGKSIVEKSVCNFSWSADHRVIDGATMARAGDLVRRLVEEPELMMVHLS
ncbi:hypothetical protein TD95_002598 [Thielaviopsis punctulata]|uniref:Dihydrolipoamide acetyltransferase component of pyruvate dehydrogenase complex n=1 Tax=Thielaviopsis punctulata TaxID=72032 RepID=A0A0F4ZLP2_9PEZI|nr:hypothetical protein TD95_002598 [Thielaviopsis punctulata]